MRQIETFIFILIALCVFFALAFLSERFMKRPNAAKGAILTGALAALLAYVTAS